MESQWEFHKVQHLGLLYIGTLVANDIGIMCAMKGNRGPVVHGAMV